MPESALTAEVFVTPSIPAETGVPGARSIWSPISATLISGTRDAVLVDAFLTEGQARDLGDWIEASGKNLTTIYLTHGHGDHFFGMTPLLRRFPGARAVATPGTVAHMHQELEPEFFQAFWESTFPGQLPNDLQVAQPLAGSVIDLEGHELRAVEAGYSDTHDTTFLHVPSLDLVVAGDIIYNGVHQYLARTSKATRQQWIAAVDQVAALHPKRVVAGHKAPGAQDSPRAIADTRAYLTDFDELLDKVGDPAELVDAMLARYPDRLNPDALRLSVRRVFASERAGYPA
ncbi:MBL fold metallo-hydrolase [Nocardia sp. NPDC049149]|uniref:MBL fold metallo-hydrolase n=1 Tax=Nocardia sp. NPDC049149 TaxID=3364315 RepID=UPI003710B654